MNNINLVDILTGNTTTLPFELGLTEQLDLVVALADKLAAIRDVACYDADDPETKKPQPSEIGVLADNYLSFLMNEENNFPIEHMVRSTIQVIRRHKVDLDSNTPAFTRYFKLISPFIVSPGDQDSTRGEKYQQKNVDPSPEAPQESYADMIRRYHTNAVLKR